MTNPTSMGATPVENQDLLTLARERVRIAPPPEWTSPSAYDRNFSPKSVKVLTHLLIEQQAHAERRERYTHTAFRLETMQAVQHKAQWRLEFEPKTMLVTLHSVKTWRGNVEKEHVSLDKIQFLQREAGLDGFIINGQVTLLLLLEDVAVGDVLEVAYTIQEEPRLLRDHFSAMFMLPVGSEIGKHHFSLRYAPKRPIKWKSSSQGIAPLINANHDETELLWHGENVVTLTPEEGAPLSLILFPWLQCSDLTEWQQVANGVHQAWPTNESAGDGFLELVTEIKNVSAEQLVQANEAIRIVQDRFRYLSVDLELGGHIPADPETVIRRKYGDCKDLSFLLTQLLRAIGVSARPVLVNTAFCKSVSELLPTAQMFNHVIVEFQIGNERRWIDATMKHQGGGALDHWVSDFGVGLPVDPVAKELVSVPQASLPSGTLEWKDHLLLDTAGGPSHLSVLVVAKGMYADAFRADFANVDASAMATSRLQGCANSYYQAKRIGELKWRDDREKNEFTVAESFEVEGFLKVDQQARTCFFDIRNQTAVRLGLPPQIVRRDPFALPYPCNQTYILEMDFTGMDFLKIQPYESDSKYFKFSRASKSLSKYLKTTFTITTLANAVPAKEMTEYRKQVEMAMSASGIRLHLPAGYRSMRRRSDFGSLPPEPRQLAASARTVAAPPIIKQSAPVTVYAPDGLTTGATSETAPIAEKKKEEPRRTNRTAERRTKPWPQSPREPYSPRTNRKAAVSFLIFAISILALFLDAGLTRSHLRSVRMVVPVLALVILLVGFFSMCLAAIGLYECIRYPGKYSGGKSRAILTLTFGGLFVIFLTTAVVKGFIEGYKLLAASTESSSLKFDEFHFLFRPPPQPWKQVDARIFGPDVLAGFARPGRINTAVFAEKLHVIAQDPLPQVIQQIKEAQIRTLQSYRILSEKMISRNGINGYQIETLANFQGRERLTIDWIVATNGCGYLLRTSCFDAEMQDTARQAAEEIDSCFEPISPQPAGQIPPDRVSH